MKRVVISAVASVACVLAVCASASAAPGAVEHLNYQAGPYTITPGANLILLDANKIPKPTEDGFMTRMAPNLHYAKPDGSCCGGIPRVDVIHLHHGVWLSNGADGAGEGKGTSSFYPFMAAGEEKTTFELPKGYGYPIRAKDSWVLNYMIHNLTSHAAKVYITYSMDFIPANSPAALGITPVHPIWMDVESGKIYPVFDVHRFSGKHGIFTFPDMARNPYPDGVQRNLFTVDHAGSLVVTGGHVHPGGLYDDLVDIRAGATPHGGAIPGPVPHSVRLFRSYAHYWDPRGPISWDMAMKGTLPDWRPRVNVGDVLRISATYDTRRASWYESMGIMVVWEAWNDQRGVDPFAHRIDQRGRVTHGHLAENDHHGGASSLAVNLSTFKTCARKKVVIAGFRYNPGDFTSSGSARCTPTVRKGQSLTFVNADAYIGPPGDPNIFAPSPFYVRSIFHSVTSCQYPCSLNTGISYPLANGGGSFDSAQLGYGTPAADRLSWSTPAGLKPGTYTFYCRIHPFMRGVFRVIG